MLCIVPQQLWWATGGPEEGGGACVRYSRAPAEAQGESGENGGSDHPPHCW